MPATQQVNDDTPPVVRAVRASFDCLQEAARREGVDLGDALRVWFMWAVQAAIDADVSRADVLEAMETGLQTYIQRLPQQTIN